jgi:hypothetical protein
MDFSNGEWSDLVPQTLAAVKEQLGESAFQSAWEEGSLWRLEEAMERALEEKDEGRRMK